MKRWACAAARVTTIVRPSSGRSGELASDRGCAAHDVRLGRAPVGCERRRCRPPPCGEQRLGERHVPALEPPPRRAPRSRWRAGRRRPSSLATMRRHAQRCRRSQARVSGHRRVAGGAEAREDRRARPARTRAWRGSSTRRQPRERRPVVGARLDARGRPARPRARRRPDRAARACGGRQRRAGAGRRPPARSRRSRRRRACAAACRRCRGSARRRGRAAATAAARAAAGSRCPRRAPARQRRRASPGRAVTSTSRGSSRGGKRAPASSPAGCSAGRSLRLCTATSIVARAAAPPRSRARRVPCRRRRPAAPRPGDRPRSASARSRPRRRRRAGGRRLAGLDQRQGARARAEPDHGAPSQPEQLVDELQPRAAGARPRGLAQLGDRRVQDLVHDRRSTAPRSPPASPASASGSRASVLLHLAQPDLLQPLAQRHDGGDHLDVALPRQELADLALDERLGALRLARALAQVRVHHLLEIVDVVAVDVVEARPRPASTSRGTAMSMKNSGRPRRPCMTRATIARA